MNEQQLFQYANTLAAKLNITQNQIKEMPQRKGTSQQSGSDWILINKNGMMVRAQVKNSTSMVEELRNQGGRYGQTLKLQDEILYPSFRNNLQLYSQASGGLSDQDWEYLDYLIANLLWIRSGNAVTKDKGGSYNSGVSGIQQIINDLLSQELGYFLGISFDPIQKSQAVTVMLGGSNIFFVINNIMLYPTWKLVENIIHQLQKAQNYLMKIHVSLSAGSLPNRSSFIQDLQQAQQDNTEWQLGDPYGSQVLAS